MTCQDRQPRGTNFRSSFSQAQWHHRGVEPLGRPWHRGDVVGCLVDLAERTMIVALNGEVLFNGRGSELAAKDFHIADGREDVSLVFTPYSVGG